MSKNVFISYSTHDQPLAEQLCQLLEQRGITCWIAPRDITPGADYDEAILDAIQAAEAAVLILSSHANESHFVKNEVNLAFSNGKKIFPFRIEDVMPGKSLAFYLASYQWTDGFPPHSQQRSRNRCDRKGQERHLQGGAEGGDSQGQH